MKMQHPNTDQVVDAEDRAEVYASQGWKPVDESPDPDACPTCGATGDEPCHTASGNVRDEPHAGRPQAPA